MASKNVFAVFVCLLVTMATLMDVTGGMSTMERRGLRDQVVEMFNHAYSSYMKHAYPADELMPLSCKGRYRGRERSRGDIDECMGNFSLTLIDSLDSLAILGQLDEFENAVRLVIKNTKFDSDVVVSVFETNIRVLGGLLGGHVVASFLKKKRKGMLWYNNELRDMAREVGMRLLPAFNTTTGIPYPKVNLLHGIDADLRSRHKDTCTACAGTIILEFAALSRLTGESIFEEKARKAMDYLWQQRHRVSDLVGTVINIHNGDWVRRESGVGAGIDSYYEYVLKGYILLGDNTYLERFNKHYDAVMKYISQGPLLVDVHMHKPQSTSRNFMDSLLAFWPGLQVLKGDLKPAIETHEMLFQVIKRHNFLPEAFTTDFRIHWGQHPLRPEFVESTYFLYKATNDPYYLEVGKKVIENLNKHARVPCGYASIKDVTIGNHEDQMDSFVLAETFKYLYLLFAEEGDSIINVDDYIFTTEAHLLPLTLSIFNSSRHNSKIRRESYQKIKSDQKKYKKSPPPTRADKQTCPNLRYLHRGEPNYAHSVREQLKDMVENISPKPKNNRRRFRAIDFMAGNKEQLEILGRMGIRLMTMTDGRIQLLHTASEAASPMDAEDGMKFMQEMIELSKNQHNEAQHEPLIVQLLPPAGDENTVLSAGPAQFGYNLKNSSPIQGQLVIADPYKACTPLTNAESIKGYIAILERGDCMFIEKASNIEAAGAIGGIVIDHNHGSSSDTSPLFAMSGDGHRDVGIPLVFLFHKEGQKLLETLSENYSLEVLLALDPRPSASQTKTPTDVPPKMTPAVGTNRPRKTFQHLKTIQSFQTPPHAIKAEEFLYQPAMDRKPYNVKREPLVLEDKDGNYFIRVGSNNVYMEISIVSLSSSSSSSSASSLLSSSSKLKKTGIIHLHLLPDGTKRLAFHFAHLSKREPSQNKPKLNQIYVELVSLLRERTNFPQLDLQSQYLRAITRVLEAAYFNFGKLDASEKVVLDQLAFELIIIKDEPPFGMKEKSVADESNTHTQKEDGVEKETGNREKEQDTEGLSQEQDTQINIEPNTENSQSDNEGSSSSQDGENVAEPHLWLRILSENSKNDNGVYFDKMERKTDVTENIEEADPDENEKPEDIQLPSFPFGEGDAGQQEQVEPSAETEDREIPVESDCENILIVNNDHSDDSTELSSDPSDSLLDSEQKGKDEL